MAFYLARDKNGTLCLYDKKPTRDKKDIEWYCQEYGKYFELPNTKFVNIRWEDEQPRKIKFVSADSQINL